MRCTVTAMRSKEVVNIDNGCRLGCVTDVEIDTCTGCLVSITVFCGKGICGFFGRGEEIIYILSFKNLHFQQLNPTSLAVFSSENAAKFDLYRKTMY